jgi:sugar lactone lactonase YvrE
MGIAVACAAVALWWQLPWLRTVALAPGWPAIVAVLAGDGVAGTRDGEAADARFADPFGVAIAPDGTVYVADGGNLIRRISPDGRVTTVAGGARGFADGVGGAARFNTPSALAIDAGGALYVADTGNNAIRRMTADGRVTTVAGDGVAGYRDGPAREARFNAPIGVAVDASGRVIVADT